MRFFFRFYFQAFEPNLHFVFVMGLNLCIEWNDSDWMIELIWFSIKQTLPLLEQKVN